MLQTYIQYPIYAVFILFIGGILFQGSIYYIKKTKGEQIPKFKEIYKKAFAYDPNWKKTLLSLVVLVAAMYLISIFATAYLSSYFNVFVVSFMIALGTYLFFSGLALLLAVFRFHKEGDTTAEINIKVNLTLIIFSVIPGLVYVFTRESLFLLIFLVLLFAGSFGYVNIKRFLKKKESMEMEGNDSGSLEVGENTVEQPSFRDSTIYSFVERIGGAFSHGLALIPMPAFNILITLLYWLIVRKKSDFMDHHGKQSLNFQISFTLYPIIIVLITMGVNMVSSWQGNDNNTTFQLLNFTVGFVGIAFFIVIIVSFSILAIIAIIAALFGKKFKYPITILFLK
ncbi:MAG: DUF4870 domain-containing protein [Bacillus sp. (in: Bacteria)]|nr:DUF4870 domain-containing protein [Bacillus sp. (in: firmicutes)]